MELISKDKIKETLSRSKFSNEFEIELYGLYEVCENISDSKLFEYIPIKIVACFEAFFRCVYTEIMDNPRFRGRLGNVKQLKNTNFNFEILEECDVNELDNKEIAYIKQFNSYFDGYNQTQGGSGSSGTIVKISLNDLYEIYDLLLNSNIS